MTTQKSQIMDYYKALKTLSLTLREERRLRVFENRVLRRIFGSKRERSNRRLEKAA
jgi:hypothetical protein